MVDNATAETIVREISTEAIVRDVLGMTYDQFGFQQDTELIADIVKVLDDINKMVKDNDDPNDASEAAEYVRECLWNRFSGGGASAGATTGLFFMLGREDELGWVRGESRYSDSMLAELPERVRRAREAKQNA